MTAGAVLLASGLPLRSGGRDPPTSFQRQLELLAEGFHRAGWQARVAGPEEAQRLAAGEAGWEAAILLGYPDQFPFLQSEPVGLKLYLWAQCSRPPDPHAFGRARAVPLTPLSAAFLAQAGVPSLGPVIPHAVDASVFRPLDAGERARARRALGLEGCFVVGAVGANSYRKRFDLILTAFALFAEGRPQSRLLIKTDRLMSREGADLSALARRFGVADRVRLLTDELSSTAMRKLYGALDVFVNLSEWEGFGLPVAEAMACGIPVVTHRVQGAGELAPCAELVAEDSLPYEENGSRLLAAQPQTVARLLARAADEPSLRREASERGLQAARLRFELQGVVERWRLLITADRE